MDDRQQRNSGLPVPPTRPFERPWDRPAPARTGQHGRDDTADGSGVHGSGALGFLRRHLMSVVIFLLLASGILIQAWRDLSRPDAWDYWKDLYSTPSLTSQVTDHVALDGRQRKALVLRGKIGPAAASWLRDRVDEARLEPGDLVLLSSPGGDLGQSVIMGEIIRARGLVTAVGTTDASGRIRPGSCASACVFVYAGGTARYDIAGSRLGVHRFTTRGTSSDPVADTQRVTGLVLSYLKRMGISASLVEAMSATSDIRWLDSRQAAEMNLVTAQVRGPQG
ncbi:MAG: hypothetical protein AB7I42_22260 [Bradyrhizobium sp.]|uniref:COG3904 family protein n=1 Tax=Bradyrhizobium sp. TaxID=376 RepID=UPI003D10F2FE